jgi:Uma2 family endonuclease
MMPTVTTREYLDTERRSEDRHEYLDGFVYLMAGESPAHSRICFDLALIVGMQLRGTPCEGFSPNMKVRTGEQGLFAYPDLTIVCGEPVFHDERGDVLVNPTVIFEVLSPSTAAYDRGEKSLRYRTQIETLRDFVLIAQDRPHVEHLSRQPDGSWETHEVSGLDGVLNLDSIGCRVPLADLYSRITFAES